MSSREEFLRRCEAVDDFHRSRGVDPQAGHVRDSRREWLRVMDETDRAGRWAALMPWAAGVFLLLWAAGMAALFTYRGFGP
jgi:hypothetical protein